MQGGIDGRGLEQIREQNQTRMIHATLSAKPKRRINMVRWMQKHRISGQVTSLDHATMLAIERTSIMKYDK